MRGAAFALLAVLATCGGTPQPVFQARFAVRGRWSGAREISVRIDGANGPVAEARLRSAVESALAQWSATGLATFRFASEEERADVEIAWRTGAHAPCIAFGTDTSVAHTGPAGPGTFVHFDAERAWDSGELTLDQVALHELGHVLGLDHSEDEEAVMHPVPSRARSKLSRSDLDGLHSVYGGGADRAGDLVVLASDGREVARLGEVAPRELCGWSVFDADGDSNDEVLAWRTDESGFGALTLFHFNSAGELTRTTGPMYGVVPPGAAVETRIDAAGRRVLVASLGAGPVSLHVFDDRGRITAAERSETEAAPAANTTDERAATFGGTRFVVRRR